MKKKSKEKKKEVVLLNKFASVVFKLPLSGFGLIFSKIWRFALYYTLNVKL